MVAEMNQWSEALKSLAPKAGDPGRGTGNLPYAPGIVSGDPSTPGSSSELFGGLDREMRGQQARTGMTQATAAPSNTPQSMQSPQAPPQQMQWTPQVQAQVMNYLMTMLRQTGRNWKMTTTGGVQQRDYNQGY